MEFETLAAAWANLEGDLTTKNESQRSLYRLLFYCGALSMNNIVCDLMELDDEECRRLFEAVQDELEDFRAIAKRHAVRH